MKTQLAPQTYTLVKGMKPSSKKLHVFEGFLDFATLLDSVDRIQPNHDTIILNSLNNTKHVVQYIRAEYSDTSALALYLWLDNEEPGSGAEQAVNKALRLLADTGAQCLDARGIYAGYKDPNEKWTREGKQPFHFAFKPLELPPEEDIQPVAEYKKPLPLFGGMQP